MAGNKTADGKFKLSQIVDAASQLPGVTVTAGHSHPYVLKYDRAPVGNCAVATSTNTDRHLVPWFKQVTGYSKPAIYEALKKGRW